MKAEIISVGTEMLLGELVDTNSQYIAQRLPALGIDCYWITKVGDNLGRLSEAIQRALGRSDLVVTTGGLGPTEDDLTREAIAAALGEEVYLDPDLEARVRETMARRGRSFPERNLKQAWLIASAHAIPNPRGSAPGWWTEKDGRIIVSMPGVPHEMYRMWDEEVTPELAKRPTGSVIITRIVKTSGIPESQVDEMVSDLLHSENPSIGVYAKQDGTHLRIGAKAATREKALAMIVPVEEEMRRILGSAVWGVGDQAIESVVGQMLAERGLTLATMESCTGGLLASAITDVYGSSEYFIGGFVTYTTRMKIDHGVDPGVIEQYGVISVETAKDMARAARVALGADIGLGITGVAGPEPVEGHPEGTVHFGLDFRGDLHDFTYTFGRSRQRIKHLAVTNALQLLRRVLVETNGA